MKKYDIIFSDLDGTLINTISGETFPKRHLGYETAI